MIELGHVYEIPPEPYVEASTYFIQAGPVRIGLEYRAINNATLEDSFSNNAGHALALKELLDGRSVTDRGTSLHVCASDDGHEYLRFDCFDETPHYHYNHKVAVGEAPRNHVVLFDRAACGDMFEWAIDRIAYYLPAMLTQAGAVNLAQELDKAALIDAASQLRTLARSE